jgi:hypothetical protein
MGSSGLRSLLRFRCNVAFVVFSLCLSFVRRRAHRALLLSFACAPMNGGQRIEMDGSTQ